MAKGSSVANTFLKLPEWRVRGVTRNPLSPAAQVFAQKGIEIVKADLNDKNSLISAFQGANAIFAVTDFWAPFSDPDNIPRATARGVTINEYAYAVEIDLGINVAQAAADSSVSMTLEHYIFSSLADVRKWSKEKYTWVYHFDSKAKVVHYIKECLPALHAKMSTVQIGFYATNWKMRGAWRPRKQPDGSFIIKQPQDGKSLVPFVVTSKDTGEFVKALIQVPPGKNILGVSEQIGWEEWVKIWGATLKVQARYEKVSMEEYLNGLPENLSREVGESVSFCSEFGWTGGDPEILNPREIAPNIQLTTVAEYIRSEDWSSVL
jgi:NmrA-like family